MDSYLAEFPLIIIMQVAYPAYSYISRLMMLHAHDVRESLSLQNRSKTFSQPLAINHTYNFGRTKNFTPSINEVSPSTPEKNTPQMTFAQVSTSATLASTE